MKKTIPEDGQSSGQEDGGQEARGQEDDAMAQSFGLYLSNLRKGQKLTQQQLAKRAKISTGYAGFFEQGRQIPSKRIMESLAVALDVSYLEMLKMAGLKILADDHATENDVKKARARLRGNVSENPLSNRNDLNNDEEMGSHSAGNHSADRRNGGTLFVKQPNVDSLSADPLSQLNERASAQITQKGTTVDTGFSANVNEDSSLHTTTDPAMSVAEERLSWALECIRRDPDFRWPPLYESQLQVSIMKLLLIFFYQAQTQRQLLTPSEIETLNQMADTSED